jgi:hypothetical protein
MLSTQMQTLMAKATTKSGDLDGELMEQAMFGRTGLGGETMTAAFGPQRVALYKEFINALKVAQRGQSHGTGSMFIQMKQAGASMQVLGAGLALGGMATDDYSTEGLLSGGAFIISPYVLSRLMTSPTTAKWIIQGVKTPAGTPAATGLAGRILSNVIPHLERIEPPDTAERRVQHSAVSTRPPSMALQE